VVEAGLAQRLIDQSEQFGHVARTLGRYEGQGLLRRLQERVGLGMLLEMDVEAVRRRHEPWREQHPAHVGGADPVKELDRGQVRRQRLLNHPHRQYPLGLGVSARGVGDELAEMIVVGLVVLVLDDHSDRLARAVSPCRSDIQPEQVDRRVGPDQLKLVKSKYPGQQVEIRCQPWREVKGLVGKHIAHVRPFQRLDFRQARHDRQPSSHPVRRLTAELRSHRYGRQGLA